MIRVLILLAAIASAQAGWGVGEPSAKAVAHQKRCLDAGVALTGVEFGATAIVAAAMLDKGWSSFVAVFPMVGGTASAHALDLALNVAGQDLTWSGTVTHSSTGATGNGSTGYALTALSSVNLNTNGVGTSVSMYCRNTASGSYFGATDGTNAAIVSGSAARWPAQNNGSPLMSFSSAAGYMLIQRTSTTSAQVFRGGIEITQSTATLSHSIPASNRPILIMANRSGSGGTLNYSTINWCFFHAATTTFSDAEAAQWSAAITSAQRILGRQ